MPELPEVETTRRGVEPYVRGVRVSALRIHEPRLRWPVPRDLPNRIDGARIVAVERRAKYLLFRLDSGDTLLLHLGMSGSLRVLPADTPAFSAKDRVQQIHGRQRHVGRRYRQYLLNRGHGLEQENAGPDGAGAEKIL